MCCVTFIDKEVLRAPPIVPGQKRTKVHRKKWGAVLRWVSVLLEDGLHSGDYRLFPFDFITFEGALGSPRMPRSEIKTV